MTSVAPPHTTVARDISGAETLLGAARLFTRFPTPRLLAANVAALAVARAFLGPPGLGDAIAVAAVAAYWPLQKWVLHKHVLHFRPRRLFGKLVDPLFSQFHRYHHDHPWVLERTFLPTRVLVPLMPVNVAVFWALAPSWGVALTGAAAMSAAALVYEWTHYLTHTPYKPRSSFYARIHKNHMQHHFKDDARYFAFAVPAIDRAMGTSD